MNFFKITAICAFFLPFSTAAYTDTPPPRAVLATDQIFNNLCDGTYMGYASGYITFVGMYIYGPTAQFYINFLATKDNQTYVYFEDADTTLDTTFGKSDYAAALQARAIGSQAVIYCNGKTNAGYPSFRGIAF